MNTEKIQRRFERVEMVRGAFGVALLGVKMAHRGFFLSFPGSGMAQREFFLAFPGWGMMDGSSFSHSWDRGRRAGRCGDDSRPWEWLPQEPAQDSSARECGGRAAGNGIHF